MTNNNIINVSRRQFLIQSAGVGAGLTLGVYLTGCSKGSDTKSVAGPGLADDKVTDTGTYDVNAFIGIGTDNTVTVVMKHLEMGQGSHTGMATLVAEEMDASWDQIKYQAAPANPKLYNHLYWGKTQGTGGSSTISNAYMQMRKAGAIARHMLTAAAAQQWKVNIDDLTVKNGRVIHTALNKFFSFGELAELAAQQTIPEEVFLKDPSEFTLVGSKLHRKDSYDKTNGKAIYTQDIKLPNMLIALVAHPPRFGATVKSFDATATKLIKGVVDVVQIPTGIAVLAEHFWSAKKGRDALAIEWDNTQAFNKSSDSILAGYKRLSSQPGLMAKQTGNTEKAFKNAFKVLEASYEYPYLAHAALEPMNCVVQLHNNGVEIWNGAQMQTRDQTAVADLFDLKPEQIKINTLYAGGSFGRRANPHSDYVLEAANIAKAIKGKIPIKLMWTREDDIKAGYYRPLYYHTIKAALNKHGKPIAWQHRIVGQSILAGTVFASNNDISSAEGASNIPYAIPNIQVDLHSPTQAVPVQWWRSVHSTHTAFSVETFIDELATAAKQDPVDFRRTLMKGHSRHLGVMELASNKAGWYKPLTNVPGAKARGRGIAVHESFSSYVAQVAEITINNDNSFSVDRIVIAVDCGIAINPDVIRAQMEGGMGFGLAAALSSKITLKDGQVEQSNFHDYTVLTMDQMPKVEVYIIASTEPPTGVGEPATPVIAPALANALFAATGKRLYQLPLQLNA